MNYSRKIIIVLFGIALITSCGSDHQKDGIRLNDGQKWKVNAEMTPHIDRGNEILDQFMANKGSDYHKLAEDLKTQNQQLIKSCTMKGQSHDELHKWLHPHMALIEKLQHAKNPGDAAEIVGDIKQSFTTYKNYFE